MSHMNAQASSCDWLAMLKTNDKGNPLPGLTLNWTVVLEHHPDARGMLALDEFSGRTMLLRRPPWDLRKGDWKPRAVGNNDLAEAVEWLEGFGLTPKVFNINPIIDKVAGRHPYHPVKDWLSSLPAWDGTPRVDTFLTCYLGAQDTRLNRAFARKWLSALARRVFDPGCQFDHVLTLQGKQGLGKSSFGRALVPVEEWVTDGLTVGESAREVIEITRGRWVVELAELAGRSTREIETIRKFITIRVDTARGAYQQKPDDVPRQFAFYATTNADEFLTDTSGNRRWWPVRPAGIDLAAIRADRVQIWAEVMTICEHEPLWLDDPVLKADLEALHHGVMDFGPTYDIIRDLIPDGDMMVPCADMRKLLTGGSEDASRLPAGWRGNLQRALAGLGFDRFRRLSIAAGAPCASIVVAMGTPSPGRDGPITASCSSKTCEDETRVSKTCPASGEMPPFGDKVSSVMFGLLPSIWPLQFPDDKAIFFRDLIGRRRSSAQGQG